MPITRHLTNEEVTESYEWNTGKVIVEAFENQNLDPSAIPTVLVNGHGPFTWGTTTQKAIENSLVLDECCQTAQMTESVRSNAEKLPQNVLDKHYYHNHGTNAYYGQN